MQPKVSVIIPVFNVEKYLKDCLISVSKQTLNDIEIICVEDGSTDNSKEILKEYALRDSRIKIIWHEHNSGLVKTRKDGVMIARGKYIMFLDSDDELLPHACETAYTMIERNKTDALQFGVYLSDPAAPKETVKFWDTDEISSLTDCNLLVLWQNGRIKNWNIWTKIYRTNLCQTAYKEMSDAYIVMAEDVYFFCVFGYYAKSISMIREKLYLYRYGSGISTNFVVNNSINLYYYKKILAEKDCLNAIERFIGSKPDKEKYNGFVQALQEHFLYGNISIWKDRVVSDNKKDGLIAFSKKWGAKKTAEGIFWLLNKEKLEQEHLREGLENARNECAQLREELADARNEIVAVQQRASEAEMNWIAIRSGWSFRLGRVITYIPRKLLGRP